MKIRVAELPSEPIDLTHVFDESWVEGVLAGTGLRPATSCTLRVRATLIDPTLLLQGEVECRAAGPCDRCLCDTEIDLGGSIDLVLEPRRLPEDWEVDDEDVENAGFEFYDGREADLEPYVREFLSLGIPMNVVCSDDCKGLCPDCGKNLNEGPCGC